MYKLKKDKYKSARGGYSRLLDISCGSCGKHICYYQKDGPGILKRMYLDRIEGMEVGGKDFSCPACKKVRGTLIVYEKEKRDAYRLFVGSVVKKIVSVGDMK